jgi:hypothetical protein
MLLKGLPAFWVYAGHWLDGPCLSLALLFSGRWPCVIRTESWLALGWIWGIYARLGVRPATFSSVTSRPKPGLSVVSNQVGVCT